MRTHGVALRRSLVECSSGQPRVEHVVLLALPRVAVGSVLQGRVSSNDLRRDKVPSRLEAFPYNLFPGALPSLASSHQPRAASRLDAPSPQNIPAIQFPNTQRNRCTNSLFFSIIFNFSFFPRYFLSFFSDFSIFHLFWLHLSSSLR